MHGEGDEIPGAERTREQRVVAELLMRVERQVVGGERDVGVEQQREAALQQRIDDPRARAPEQPVVDEQQPDPLPSCHLEQLRMRGHATGQRRDLLRSGHLQAVDAVVLEALGPQEPVGLLQDLMQRRGHSGEDSGVEYSCPRRGVAQPGSAHRSGR